MVDCCVNANEILGGSSAADDLIVNYYFNFNLKLSRRHRDCFSVSPCDFHLKLNFADSVQDVVLVKSPPTIFMEFGFVPMFVQSFAVKTFFPLFG